MRQWQSLRLLFVMLLSAGLCAAIVACAIFWVDPFQYFRRSPDQRYSELMQRFQAPGIARNYDFDEIVVGSSTVANLSPSLFRQFRDARVQNLSFWGGTLNEAYNVVRLSLRGSQLKAVYWAVDPVLVLPDFRYPDFPQCMYHRISSLLPYCYLLNRGVLAEVLASKLSSLEISRAGWVSNLDRWKHVDAAPFDRSAFGCEILRRISHSRPLDVARLDQMKRKFSKLVVETIRQNRETHFNIIFPPLFAPELWLRTHDNPETLPFIDWAEQQISSLPNASVFDFQLAADIVEEEGNYRDTLHANPNVAALMVQWLATGRYEVGPSDLEKASATRQHQADAQESSPLKYRAYRCSIRG